MRHTTLAMQAMVVVVFHCFLSAVPLLAVDKIDSGFGNNGFAVKDFGIGDDEALALAVQPDGKLLVAGYSSNGAVMNLTVARYLADGTLDISFNHDGLFTLGMGTGNSIARSIVVQNDGRILVAGSTFDMGPGIAVIALTAEGYADPGFGDNGQVVIPVQDEAVVTADLKTAADGSIVIAATIESSDSSRYPLFAKMLSDGGIAADFGDNGIIWEEADYSVEVHGLALLDEGKILVAGSIEQDGVMQAGLLRRNADGTADMTFGSEGELVLGIEGVSSVIYDLLAESAGSILLAGSVKNENFLQAFAVRLKEDGTLDPYFAGDGLFSSNLQYDTVAHGIAVQPDGTVVLAGFGASGSGQDMIVWNIADHQVPSISSEDMVILDAEQQIVLRALSVSGGDVKQNEDTGQMEQQVRSIAAPAIVTDIAEDDDVGYAIVALGSGQVLAAGSTGNGTDKDFVLVRYTSENSTALLAAADSSAGIRTGALKVITSPVVDVTRIGAETGGTIVVTSLSCETSCTTECREFLEDEDLSQISCSASDSGFEYDTCVETCQDERTVTKRGVVFSVYQNPVYRIGEEVAAETDTPADTVGNSYSYETVRSGQTEDGSGTGSYGSDIQGITPNVTYYVRAYAVLGDGESTVIYGNQLTFKTDDACFIATAAYGSLLDGHVALLRQFRDRYLMPFSQGRKVVAIYYHFSPALADIVNSSIVLRGIARIVLWPFVGLALFMLKVSSTIKFMVIMSAVLIAGFCLRPKTCSQTS